MKMLNNKDHLAQRVNTANKNNITEDLPQVITLKNRNNRAVNLRHRPSPTVTVRNELKNKSSCANCSNRSQTFSDRDKCQHGSN